MQPLHSPHAKICRMNRCVPVHNRCYEHDCGLLFRLKFLRCRPCHPRPKEDSVCEIEEVESSAGRVWESTRPKSRRCWYLISRLGRRDSPHQRRQLLQRKETCEGSQPLCLGGHMPQTLFWPLPTETLTCPGEGGQAKLRPDAHTHMMRTFKAMHEIKKILNS
jgi:hypothetical protein